MEKHWYAINSKHRNEDLAEQHLARQGFEVYLPKIQAPRKLRGVKRMVIAPLFPRYLFVKVSLETENTAPIRSTRGVTGFVRLGGFPKQVPSEIVDQLKSLEDDSAGMRIIRPEKFLKGDKVKIMSGPFAGNEGIFQAASGEARVIILLNLLGKIAPTKLSEGDIERIS